MGCMLFLVFFLGFMEWFFMGVGEEGVEKMVVELCVCKIFEG